MCTRAGVAVEREYHAGEYTLNADPDLLYRAFVNLFSNAVQAMPEGGLLKVRTTVMNGKGAAPRLELRIQDTGPGIPRDLWGKIFNPFFTTREKGTGLGLAIVRSVIDSHQGEIEVESRNGEGTTMIIRLPLSASRPE
jgi:signal transduction histidine kinase